MGVGEYDWFGRLYKRSKALSLAMEDNVVIYRFGQGLCLSQVVMLQEGITRSSATLSKLARELRKVLQPGKKQ
ncbi:hypothetical protein AOLI_G00052960 [Acnodon oligacanthus]